ncbi:nucleoside permease [Psychromonas ossibalaenae]|uniref:nucleoside permease n=1 Tax=Psychromonas ossibalaenae TaxID=444922 RepID=UPI0003692738|nr:nucleoside permease [Psychromonas ossibalaenae]
MKLKLKIGQMQFLQFIAWGSWLITIGAYAFNTKGWSASEFSAVFSTIGISALFMPPLIGAIADRWINAERLYSLLHLACALCMLAVPMIDSADMLFWVMLVNMCFYMPTISLAYSISYRTMEDAGMDIIKEYPPLRVWGTIGFAAGMWCTSLSGLETSAWQFYISAFSSLMAALLALTLPKCTPLNSSAKLTVGSILGLDALKLFKEYRTGVFLIFAMLLGVCMQLSNAYAAAYIHDFGRIEEYADSIILKFPAVIVSLGQMSEMLFILVIPFVLKKWGIRKVMIISMVAWVFRWLLLAYGNPADGLFLIIGSMIIWGMAFDFFNLSGSLFIEKEADPAIRSSAQGLFQVMVVGLGAIIGSVASGWLIDNFFTHNGVRDWQGIMLSFAAYSAVVTVLFIVLFKDEKKQTNSMTTQTV